MRLRESFSRGAISYGAAADYHFSPSTMRTVRVAIGVWCWLHGVTAVLLLNATIIESSVTTRVTWCIIGASTVFTGAMWIRGPWPSRGMSLAFVVYAEIGVSTVLTSVSTPLLALPATALLTVIGSYVAVFHGFAAFVTHAATTLAVCVSIYLRAVAQAPQYWSIASAYMVILALVLFGTPALVLVLVILLRRDADTAFYDTLTGLRNRRGLTIALKAIAEAPGAVFPTAGIVLSIALIDIDKFKTLNDCHGHAYGDTVLRSMANQLASTFPPPVVTARLGGEEFVVVAHTLTAWRNFGKMLETFAQGVERSTSVTVSIGIADAPSIALSSPQELEHALARADGAMYAAKRAGGNKIWDVRLGR